LISLFGNELQCTFMSCLMSVPGDTSSGCLYASLPVRLPANTFACLCACQYAACLCTCLPL
jgi:hypothetical protein